MWHTETDIFAFIIFVIMLGKTLHMGDKSDRQHKALIGVLIVSLLSCVVDFISSTAMNLNDNWMLYEIFLTIYYVLMPVVTASWMVYLIFLISKEGSRQLRGRMILILAPVVCYSIVALTNPFTGAFFTLSDQMQYTRGFLFWPLAVGFYSIYSAAGLVILLINHKQVKPRSNMLFLSTFFAASIIIPIIQSMLPGYLIAEISYAVLFLLCDATVEEEKRRQLMFKIKEQNNALTEAVKEAKDANEAKTDFLSRMSHDIRTPLNGIIGITYITQKMELPVDVHENLGKIETSSKFLLGLVNDILDMSKMESQKIELHPEPYPFEDFCAYLDAVIQPLCDEKRQKFIFEADPLEGCTPLVDITRLNRIYFNLLSNAVKYTPEGGTIGLRIKESFLEDDHIRFTLIVSDNGIGMSSEFMDHLFEPFVQENRNDNFEQRGSGLGLAIVKKTVDAMGGSISVESTMGKGSEFTVMIDSPYVKKADATEKKKKREYDMSDRTTLLRGRHVLVCEDHPLNQEIAETLLEEKGMIVHIAEDGQKGIEKFSKSSVGYFDWILMDIRMPVLDGLGATKKIRDMERDDAKKVSIIAMTADAFSDDVEKCLDAGMDGHISKPIDPDELYETMCRLADESTGGGAQN